MSLQQAVDVVALVRDLMFSSRISAEARAVGRSIKIVRDPAALAGVGGGVLLVDLNQPDALEAAVAWRNQGPGRAVVGFAAHVDHEIIVSARGQGLDRVMPRSQFVAALPGLLASGD